MPKDAFDFSDSVDLPYRDESEALREIAATPMQAPSRRPRRRALSWAALASTVAASAGMGAGILGALSAIDAISVDPLGGSGIWATIALAGVVTGTVALVLASVALFRSRCDVVAVVATLAALILPSAAGALAIQHGVADLRARTEIEVRAGGNEALDMLQETVSAWGVDLTPLRRLIEPKADGSDGK